MIMKHHLMYSRGFNLHFIILCVQEKTAPIFFSAPFFGHVNLSLYLCFSQEKIKPYVRFYMSCVLFESQCMNLFFFSTAINEGYFRIKCLQIPCQLSLRYSNCFWCVPIPLLWVTTAAKPTTAVLVVGFYQFIWTSGGNEVKQTSALLLDCMHVCLLASLP